MASRQIVAMASLFAFGVRLARIRRFLLRMTAIALVAIGGDDVIACHRLSSLVATVPSSDAHVAFMARF